MIPRTTALLFAALITTGSLAVAQESYRAEGTPSNPVAIQIGTVHHGHVDTEVSYYTASVLSTHSYRIIVSALRDDADLYVYDMDARFKYVSRISANDDTTTEYMVIEPSGSQLYFSVNGSYTQNGTTFQVSILPGDFTYEGTPDRPELISAGFPHYGQVSTATSYYAVPVQPNTSYELSMTRLLDDADIRVYDNSLFVTSIGDSWNTGIEPERILVTSTSDHLYLAVDGSYTEAGTSFVLLVVSTTAFSVSQEFVSEGSPEEPILLSTNVWHQGQVDSLASYYAIPVEPGRRYDVVMTDLLDDADVTVFGDHQYTSFLGDGLNPGREPERFSVSSQAHHLYLRVDGVHTHAGTSYDLFVSKTVTLRNEGTYGEPLTLNLEQPHAGSVYLEVSYYRVSVESGDTYRIEISRLSDDADLDVYHDRSMRDLAGSSSNLGTRAEVVVARAKTEHLHILVHGRATDEGATYTLLAKSDGPPRTSEGLVYIIPFDLRMGKVHHGQVSTSRSYYSVATEPGAEYEVTISELTDDADLYVYDDDATYTRIQAASRNESTDVDYVRVRASGRYLYIAVDGIDYTYDGASYDLVVTALTSRTD